MATSLQYRSSTKGDSEMYKLERQSSIDGAWEHVSNHETREEGRQAGQIFKGKYANALRLRAPTGEILDEWKKG
jgi:hypothetical protein